MARIALLAAALAIAGAHPALAAENCVPLVNPGRSIGPVELGAKLADLQAAGLEMRPSERGGFLVFLDGAELLVQLDGRKRVSQVRIDASRICVKEDGKVVDLSARGADDLQPLAGCGRNAARHRSSWQCPEQGVEFFWEGAKTGASVFAAAPAKVFKAAPPPVPEPAKPIKRCEGPAAEGEPIEAAAGTEVRCWEEPPPDPCNGNIAPMPEIACGFFGRNERLALECYLTNLCMGRFTDSSAGKIQVYSEAEGWLGSMSPSREWRAMRYHFSKAPPVGARLRVVVDGEVASLLPASSIGNKAISPAEFERMQATGEAAVRVRHLVGGRQVPGGFVLDLAVPRSAYTKAPAKQAAN
ncbi:MAG: hypothetical protein ACOX6T_18200 [Myxococcales bacterium]|jgi:hypothetical protein